MPTAKGSPWQNRRQGSNDRCSGRRLRRLTRRTFKRSSPRAARTTGVSTELEKTWTPTNAGRAPYSCIILEGS
jgi:hypothetical protein